MFMQFDFIWYLSTSEYSDTYIDVYVASLVSIYFFPNSAVPPKDLVSSLRTEIEVLRNELFDKATMRCFFFEE